MSFRFAAAHLGQSPIVDPTATASWSTPSTPADSSASTSSSSASTSASGSYWRAPTSSGSGNGTTYDRGAAARWRRSQTAPAQSAAAAIQMLIQSVIAAQSARDYVARAKAELDKTDPQYQPVDYEARKKKYVDEYTKQLMRLANSIGRVTVEEKTYPGSFYDEQVVVGNLPAEYQAVFRNPMVRSALYAEFLTAITAAQKAAGADSKFIEDTRKWADAKRKEAIESGSRQWGALNLSKVKGAPATWEPVVLAALQGEGFPQVESLGDPNQVRDIAPWLAREFFRPTSPKALKLLVGDYVAAQFGASTGGGAYSWAKPGTGGGAYSPAWMRPSTGPAVSRAAIESYKKAQAEARRKKTNASFDKVKAMRRAQEAEAARQKAEAEGRAADEARHAKEKADAEAAVREAEARAQAAERAAQEAAARAEAAERQAREAASAAPTAPTTGGSTPAYSEGSSAMTAPGTIPAPPAESLAPVVTTDATGTPAVVVPDTSVVTPTVVFPPVTAPSRVSPVMALLAVAAIGGGIWWFNRRKGA